MRIGRSAKALMARGLDSGLALKLVSNGHTLASLRQLNSSSLADLGIGAEAAKAIGAGRTPIPSITLHKLLAENAYTCCACRDRRRPIVVHHIVAWSKSRSHAPDNLAVLCFDCHNKAHSQMGLAQNLTSEGLKKAKESWEHAVASFAATALLDVSRIHPHAWQYFNHLRLWELAGAVKVPFARLPGAALARQRGLIDRSGSILPRPQTFYYMYSDGDGIVLYEYVKSVMEAVLANLKVLNISDDLDRSTLLPLLAAGDIIFVQGAHYLRATSVQRRGRGQTLFGFRRANHVRVEFVVDRWEATSTSAWAWLSGRQSLGSIMQLKSIARNDGGVVLQGTVIGLLSGADQMKTRGYEGSVGYRRFELFDDDEPFGSDV
jgi:hypothetical protein